MAQAGAAYAANMATNASDPNNDALTFSKVGGPSWLSVAGNGTVSGTPLSANDGTNTFVVQVTDPGGLFGNATLKLNVIPATPILASLSLQGTNLVLSWTGGIAPYQVQLSTDLGSLLWQPVGAPVNTNTLILSISNNPSFFRVFGQ
jgi:hypothetical protein